MEVHFDFTKNAITMGARNAVEKEFIEYINKIAPEIVSRMGELPTFITHEVGFYSNLMTESRKCYEFGLFYAAVSMMGIAAERFSIEIYNKLDIKINDKLIKKEKFFGSNLKQSMRIGLLFNSGLINKTTYDKLLKINTIRNRYIHPKEKTNPKEDSLEIINLFSEVINSRFSEKYVIKEGKIVLRL